QLPVHPALGVRRPVGLPAGAPGKLARRRDPRRRAELPLRSAAPGGNLQERGSSRRLEMDEHPPGTDSADASRGDDYEYDEAHDTPTGTPDGTPSPSFNPPPDVNIGVGGDFGYDEAHSLGAP